MSLTAFLLRLHVAAWLVICAALSWSPIVLGAPPTYERDAVPLLERYCGKCHDANARKGELDLLSFAGLMKGGESGESAVAPGKPVDSPLWRMIESGEMPPDGNERPTAEEREQLRAWIEAGAAHETSEDQSQGEADLAWREAAWRVLDMLEWNCSVCHGAKTREGELDLRTVASIIRGGKSGAAIVPGEAEASLLVQKIAKNEMPPFKLRYPFAVRAATVGELASLRKWIDEGARDPGPRLVLGDEGQVVGEADRAWWAFQPVRRPAIPEVSHRNWPRGAIDAFLLAKQEECGLAPSVEVERRLFARRAFIDLTGLPPAPDEIETFLADESPAAHERLIDRLLASPCYGERQAQHWLDAAGFGESEGLESADPIFDDAWRFRDYVVRSFNDGKPLDQFLTEQIAGDELVDVASLERLTSADADRLIATGFLRSAMDSTREPAVNFPVNRLQVIDDTVDMVSTNLLGLTLRCARCHSHKYDPLSQRDYYRLAAVFGAAYAPAMWLKPGERLMTLATASEIAEIAQHNAPLETQIAAENAKLEALLAEYSPRLIEKKLAAVPEESRDALRAALAAPVAEQTEAQKALLTKFADNIAVKTEEITAEFPEYGERAKAIQSQIDSLGGQIKVAPLAHALHDVTADAPPLYLLARGDWNRRVAAVSPGAPAVLRATGDGGNGLPAFDWKAPEATSKSSARRLALARWITDPRHPLTWRVLVNRAFRDFFATGIVSTVGDFGRTGALPTHPELLDFLSSEFAERGFDPKRLHHSLATSAAYRQTSAGRVEAAAIDPENRLLWRMPLRRIDAETLRDGVLASGGDLNRQLGGPSTRHETQPDGQVIAPDSAAGRRRAVYMLRRRLSPETILETFDAPRLNASCVERRPSTVVHQSLLLLHSPFIEAQSRRLAERVRLDAGNDPSALVERLYRLVLGRAATENERLRALEFLTITDGESSDTLVELALVLFNSAEFLYVD